MIIEYKSRCTRASHCQNYFTASHIKKYRKSESIEKYLLNIFFPVEVRVYILYAQLSNFQID